jgi:threonine synthase
VCQVEGNYDEANRRCREVAEATGMDFANITLRPFYAEGAKTAAFEIVEQLGGPPDVVALPYGGGGNTRAYVMGFEETGALPLMIAVEARERRLTAASAIRIADPAHAAAVSAALERSHGRVVTVPDEAILDAWRALAQEEGVFCEPASAAGVAGLAHAGLEPGTRVVCVITGHGLKDPETAARLTPEPIAVDPDPDAIAAVA